MASELRLRINRPGHMTAIAKEASPKKLAKGPSTYGRGCADDRVLWRD